MFYTVSTTQEAWEKAKEIFTSDFQYDETASKNAGYPVYFTTEEGSNDHISDLGCRLEVNMGCDSINIWIEEDATQEQEEKEETEAAQTENEYVAEIEINYTKESGSVLKGATAYASETYFFGRQDAEDLNKAIPKIIKFMEKHRESYLYLRRHKKSRVYTSKEWVLFVANRGFGTGTITIAEYIDRNAVKMGTEREYAPKQATERILEVTAGIYYEDI